MENNNFNDVYAIANILGNLLNDISLAKNKKYAMEISDFVNRPHKILFGAIVNLAEQTNKVSLDVIDIDSYLSSFPTQYHIYQEHNLQEYIEYAKNLADKNNFEYSFNNLKKMSLLRELKSSGIDTSDIYSESKLDNNFEAKIEKFSKMTINDIIIHYNNKFSNLKNKWNNNDEGNYKFELADASKNYLMKLSQSPDVGTPMQSPLLTAIARGNRRRNIYIYAGASGTGKTRILLSEGLNLATPLLYNLKTKQWEDNGYAHKVLFISTELEEEEIASMALAFLSGVEEDIIVENRMNEEEIERVNKASEILSQICFKCHYIDNFSVSDIEDIVVENIQENKVDHVFLDYVQILPNSYSYTTERYGKNLADHQILTYMLADLKSLCNRYNIFLGTATQLNRSSKDSETKGAENLRGSYGLTDKISFGVIRTLMESKDHKDIEHIIKKGIYPTPTVYSTVFKNRGGKLKKVRVYSKFNLGNMRNEDCFVLSEDTLDLISVQPLKIAYKSVVEPIEEVEKKEVEQERKSSLLDF